MNANVQGPKTLTRPERSCNRPNVSERPTSISAPSSLPFVPFPNFLLRTPFLCAREWLWRDYFCFLSHLMPTLFSILMPFLASPPHRLILIRLLFSSKPSIVVWKFIYWCFWYPSSFLMGFCVYFWWSFAIMCGNTSNLHWIFVPFNSTSRRIS